MRKKLISLLLTGVLSTGALAGCGGGGSEGESSSGNSEGEYDLTLYSINTADPEFDQWLSNVEEGTGLKINVVASPTDSDTRQQKITTILSTGDSSVDIIEINDEMSAAFKNSGWLEGLNDTVMTEDIVGNFAQGYVENMITDNNGNIIGVPGYTGYLAFWVNQEIMDEAGITSIDTKEDFMKYREAVSDGDRYGYGGSWEKTYAFNEIAQFVNMFGGDYYDWTREENKEAIQFLYDMVQNGQTPLNQIADKYEQMNPKAIDGKYGCWFYWGLGPEYEAADMLGSDKIHMAMVPSFTDDGQRYIFTDSWNYVLNSASENKEAAVKFLQYMAGEEGMKASYECFDRYPARTDVAEKVVPDSDPAKEMYTRYAAECTVSGRPMLPQTMEFITDMGTIFQSCMQGDISVDEFCTSAQELVEKYSA